MGISKLFLVDSYFATCGYEFYSLNHKVQWDLFILDCSLRAQLYPTFQYQWNMSSILWWGRRSRRPPQGKGTFGLLTWGCFVAVLELESWIELDH